ncbi:TPA: NAD-dependent epimerase/dehydratase family protein [Campylobacter lari]|uniref:NAD-dependent epimerase/dehydratase family protein n=1 Tax=Campylobacter lari TaxID=201 RepID=UPI001DC0AAAC|nr:NAD-dependent epimerase/dehydratase family protein [Campylobacter lari]EAJ6134969.1 NAD-dependent epimerase/dehydratase family protein [Campylobacter lari]MCV3449421.1 NAD-dependent epimerase/dehydratase family protein [Campylobacter lari]MCW0223530.1 NAD-dependent epimerase/dehydratase family protein [Campylobacter lari]HEF1073721.1 NAD-dependent epimerase/dehydratase family protein [Campylobacter lari]
MFQFLKNEYDIINIKNIESIRNKTFFITGSNGLVGSNLVNYLYYVGLKRKLNLKIIAHSFSDAVFWIPKDKNIKFINSDLNSGIPDIKFDFMIHAATYGQPKKVLENLSNCIDLNGHTYIKLLNQCKKNNAKILYLSSSEVYGCIPQSQLPCNEMYHGDVLTLSDRALYAESKRIGEVISHFYHKQHKNIKIARLAISYGPGARLNDQRFLNEIINKSIDDKKIILWDDGSALRHVCFITDIIEILLNILLNGKELLYNVAGGVRNISIYDMARIVSQIQKVPLEISCNQNTIMGTPNIVELDIDKYLKEFDKKNFIDLEYGIKKTIEWNYILRQKGVK